jgi:hypothetical protein
MISQLFFQKNFASFFPLLPVISIHHQHTLVLINADKLTDQLLGGQTYNTATLLTGPRFPHGGVGVLSTVHTGGAAVPREGHTALTLPQVGTWAGPTGDIATVTDTHAAGGGVRSERYARLINPATVLTST